MFKLGDALSLYCLSDLVKFLPFLTLAGFIYLCKIGVGIRILKVSSASSASLVLFFCTPLAPGIFVLHYCPALGSSILNGCRSQPARASILCFCTLPGISSLPCYWDLQFLNSCGSQPAICRASIFLELRR
ncbi:hypothetical protein ACFX13_017275 [Malus domestica]